MNKMYRIAAIMMGLTMLQGCDSNTFGLEENSDIAPLLPQPSTNPDEGKSRPPADEPVIKAMGQSIVDIGGEPIIARGINLQFGDAPLERFDGIAPIATVGANIVRLQLREDTTANELQAAMDRIVDAGMIAMVSFWEEEGKLYCSNDETYFKDNLEALWLDEWLPVLAQRKFQSYLMINIASGWGPANIFSESSRSYDDYIQTYKEAVDRFRDLGFKVPLVIDAPGCGRDVNAFMGGRARELRENDPERNIVLSVHAYHSRWNSAEKIRDSISKLNNTGTPVIVSEFGGSGIYDELSIDHLQLMSMAQGDPALLLDVPWLSDSDKVTFARELAEPLNMVGVSVSYGLYAPRDYVDDRNLHFDFYVQDAAGRVGRWQQPIDRLWGDRWNKRRHDIAGVEDFVVAEDAPVDLSAITHIGFTLDARGKLRDVDGAFKIDNLILERGGEQAPIFLATFDGGVDDFQRSWGAGAGGGESPLTQADGQLLILPVWGDSANDGDGGGGAKTQIEISNYSPLSMDMAEPFTVSLDIFIPEEYQGENLEFTFVIKDGGWRYGQLRWIGNGDLPRGQTTTLTAVIENIATDASSLSGDFVPVGAPNAIAFAISGVTSAKSEPIRVDNFKIMGEQKASANEVYRAAFTADTNGFSRSWGAGAGAAETPLTQVDGELRVLPVWGAEAEDGGNNATDKLEASNFVTVPLDMATAFGMSMDIFIPEEYTESSLNVKLFVKDAEWKYAQLHYSGSDQLVRGEWQTVSVEISNVLEDASYLADGFEAAGAPNSFGFEVGGITTAKTEAIRVDNFVLTGPPAAEKETLLSLPFTDSAEADSFEVVADPLQTNLPLETLQDASSHGFGIERFGWIASTWIGGRGEMQALNISESEGFLEDDSGQLLLYLTERGQQIILGENGITETSGKIPVSE